MPHISLAAERLGSFLGFPINNALVTTWCVMAILIIGSFCATRNMKEVPNAFQSIAEMVVGGLYDFFSTISGKHIQKVFPLLASLFLFIIAANWVGLLPGVGTVGFFRPEETEKFVPLFRGATTDINTTLALAIVAVVAIQYYGFRTVGKHYSSRFINITNPINFFVGILEIASEVSKIVSFAFRLFGNIFAGEVLLAVIAFLMPFIVPLPFLMMELFVGFIQALVFSMLTAVFLSVALMHGSENHA
ncbi:F0F1 ATP synthase subunit A [Patescibacteria group bacterium]|nr:F0F1 ATP synthase subunit A [Patescibacteria group bacterium]MBU1473016.1 F0F1 ATP synthase subunit A [Patescibacteria group bacterium]MBU2460351.1 F0F1 ATP synthase subunit A [Patescibacteria group bacterium]